MTDDRMVFRATFHNFKPVLGRKVVQLIFEAPLEELPNIIAITGAPNPAEAPWFGIARLNNPEWP
jgi:hypothetical protein